MDKDSVEVDSNTGGKSPKTLTSTIPRRQIVKMVIAITFVTGVLLLLSVLPFILFYQGKTNVEGFKDMVLTLGSVFGAPLGIIINNYFREGDET